MTATDRLNAMQARCDAATEGPWARFSTHLGAVQMVCPDTDWYKRQHVNDVVIATLGSEPTAEFIAAARTDLPATIAALRAVLDIHLPADGAVWCTCGLLYPCDTSRAITEALT